MKTLWLKLTGAFALVIAVGIVVTVLLARQAAATQFDHFMIADRMIRPEQLQAILVHEYQHAQGWQGLAQRLPQLLATASDGAMSGLMGNMMGMHNNQLQVLDATGQVVAAAGGANNRPLALTNAQSWPLQVDNRPIGELRVTGGLMTGLLLADQRILASLTRSVLVAGLVAGLLGLLLAGLVVRQITRPLAALRVAARQIAEGDLAARVQVQTSDEVGEVATSFNQMAISLQKQESLRRHLMADVAHELRTPLAGIQGTVEAMQDGVFATSREQLGALHDEVMLLNRLVEDLRDLANAEAGQLKLTWAPVDLAALCQRQVAMLRAAAEAQSVAVELKVAGEVPLVAADAQRLAQILHNLLDNALRHTPVGGRVQVQLVATSQGVELTVVDNGSGIAPADLPHIFNRFYRAEHPHAQLLGGSGLGLAIVKQLVAAHGGEMTVQSPPPGQTTGSAFTISLAQ